MQHDFLPVLKPAVEAVRAVEDSGKLAGLERALRHIAAEAERIAESYADMGADHAGPLFNRVMGNQASDGAYFTRPVAASIAARLTLDVCGDRDWTDPAVWKEHKTLDLACGSGTLLAAMLTDMKRRAKAQGANAARIAELHKRPSRKPSRGWISIPSRCNWRRRNSPPATTTFASSRWASTSCPTARSETTSIQSRRHARAPWAKGRHTEKP